MFFQKNKKERNSAIRQAAESGKSFKEIAAEFKISENRVSQIVNHERYRPKMLVNADRFPERILELDQLKDFLT